MQSIQRADRVAHDLNNLLASIINYAAFVQEELVRATALDKDRWGQSLRDVERIQEAALQAVVVTRELSHGDA
ncbi:MAG: hypothetical protein QOF21_1626 [Actinomycetota bacterium]